MTRTMASRSGLLKRWAMAFTGHLMLVPQSWASIYFALTMCGPCVQSRCSGDTVPPSRSPLSFGDGQKKVSQFYRAGKRGSASRDETEAGGMSSVHQTGKCRKGTRDEHVGCEGQWHLMDGQGTVFIGLDRR